MRVPKHLLFPLLILIVGTVGTLAAAVQLWRTAEARDRERFAAEVTLAADEVRSRMETHIALLRGGAGLFAGSDLVTRADFRAYVSRLKLGERYPGVLGIGFSARAATEAERNALVADMRRQGVLDFHIWPADPRPVSHAITYLEPLDRRNRTALGFDMATEPIRRAAMERARDTGDAALSGRVLLVQEIENNKQPGFLIYMPVYAGADIPPTIAERRQRLTGHVYSPLRAHDLLGTLFPPRADRLIDVAIYDEQPAPDNLLYRTGEPYPGHKFSAQEKLVIAGRPWTMLITSRPAFEARSNRQLAIITLIAGLAATLLLASAALAQARATRAAEQAREELRTLNATLEGRVAVRTRELAAANSVLRNEMDRREQVEIQLRQMQRMESLGQLTGGIAHDFNNMLAIVIGSLDMIKRRSANLDTRVARLIDGAIEGAHRAATLTARLLAFSRRQPLTPEPLDANKLVAGMSELLRRTLGEQVQFETTLADGLWLTYADASQVENALLNLAVNARDAMPEGGRLAIETANVRLDDAYAARNADVAAGEYVAVCVTDSGVGMPPSVVERAFDPFFTTKNVGKGTGLGLSQVYGFVKQSNGHVRIDSEVGKGTTVRLYLPRYLGPGQPAQEPVELVTPMPEGRAEEIILVVEDEEQVRRMSVEALRDLGYTVIHAANGTEALQLLGEQPSVSLLFTDVVMPDMNGPQVAEMARRARPDLRILYTTGYTPDAVIHHDMLDPSVAFLAKPFTIEQLAVKIRATLDGKGTRLQA